MADRLLLETSGTDGYLLEDGSGVLLMEPGPVYVGSNAGQATLGAHTVVYPSFPLEIGDIAIFQVQTANQAVSLEIAAGFVEGANSNEGVGTPAAADSTLQAWYWFRLDSTSPTSPRINDSGDHQISKMHIFRRCVATGDPFDVTASATQAGLDNSLEFAGATTTVDNCLIVLLASTSEDNGVNKIDDAFSNGDLTDLGLRDTHATAGGTGGQICMATGRKASAGAFGTTTDTLASTSAHATATIALKPLAVGGTQSQAPRSLHQFRQRAA